MINYLFLGLVEDRLACRVSSCYFFTTQHAVLSLKHASELIEESFFGGGGGHEGWREGPRTCIHKRFSALEKSDLSLILLRINSKISFSPFLLTLFTKSWGVLGMFTKRHVCTFCFDLFWFFYIKILVVTFFFSIRTTCSYLFPLRFWIMYTIVPRRLYFPALQ